MQLLLHKTTRQHVLQHFMLQLMCLVPPTHGVYLGGTNCVSVEDEDKLQCFSCANGKLIVFQLFCKLGLNFDASISMYIRLSFMVRSQSVHSNIYLLLF